MAADGASGAAGLAGWKLIGGAAGAVGIGAALAATVVMLMSLPRNGREWAVALISTVLSSVCGGAAVIIKYDLLRVVRSATSDLELFVALAGLIGLVFSCGLPGWAAVRWTFNWLAKREGMDLADVIRNVRDSAGGQR